MNFKVIEKCYDCNRKIKSCVCKYIKPINTFTKFVILMHPKEFKKTKNGTGHMTNKSLLNSSIYIGIDFSNHKKVNELIDNSENSCFLLYPDSNSLNLNTQNIENKNKNIVIFIIDSTWPCSRKIIKSSDNLQILQKVSFQHSKTSQFKIKMQPNKICLSTIESTLCVLELLNTQKVENIVDIELENFLNPFNEMVKYQLECANELNKKIRYKLPNII